MTDPRKALDNLTDALVDDILKMPDDEVLMEALGDRIAALKAENAALQARLEAAERRVAELEMPVTDEEVANVLRALDTAEDTNDPRRVSGLLFRAAPELKELLTRLSRQSKSNALLVEAETALRQLMDQPTKNPISMTPDERSRLWNAHANARAILSKIEHSKELEVKEGKT